MGECFPCSNPPRRVEYQHSLQQVEEEVLKLALSQGDEFLKRSTCQNLPLLRKEGPRQAAPRCHQAQKASQTYLESIHVIQQSP